MPRAVTLPSNQGASFIGTQKNGPFDIAGELARQWLQLPNPNAKSSSEVVRPWANGIDVTRRPNDVWVVDFDKRSQEDSSLFEAPFAHVLEHVKPTRAELRRDWHRLNWWLHGDPRPAMKRAIRQLSRQIITPRVSKHRVFAWFSAAVLADSAVVAIARADDATLGVLHSRFHELWSLRLGTSLEDRPRYTPTTCFETFPFPAGLTPEVHALATAIAQAAQGLVALRDAWLNPPKRWTSPWPLPMALVITRPPCPTKKCCAGCWR